MRNSTSSPKGLRKLIDSNKWNCIKEDQELLTNIGKLISGSIATKEKIADYINLKTIDELEQEDRLSLLRLSPFTFQMVAKAGIDITALFYAKNEVRVATVLFKNEKAVKKISTIGATSKDIVYYIDNRIIENEKVENCLQDFIESIKIICKTGATKPAQVKKYIENNGIGRQGYSNLLEIPRAVEQLIKAGIPFSVLADVKYIETTGLCLFKNIEKVKNLCKIGADPQKLVNDIEKKLINEISQKEEGDYLRDLLKKSKVNNYVNESDEKEQTQRKFFVKDLKNAQKSKLQVKEL